MGFDPSVLRRELSGLSTNHRVAFCVSCSQRLLPSYEGFFHMEKWGTPEILKAAIEEVWQFLQGNQGLSRERIRDLARQCEEAAPDTERFSSRYTSAALDAASALVETLQCCEDGDPTHGVNAATSARDSVDMYIQVRDNLDAQGDAMEEAIARDPLMQREMKKQENDLSDLKQAKILTPEFVKSLWKSSCYDLLS